MAKIDSHSTAGKSELVVLFNSILTDITALKTSVDSANTLLAEVQTNFDAAMAQLDADSGVDGTDYESGLATAEAAPTAVGTLSTT